MISIPKNRLIAGFCIGFNIFAGLTITASSDAQTPETEPTCNEQVPSTHAGDRYDVMLQGDRCFLQGNTEVARKWYQLGKQPFAPIGENTVIGDPLYEPDELSNKGRVYWRNYEQYKDKETVSSGAFIPLYLLIKSDPSFVPGYSALAGLYEKKPDWCTQKAYAPICEGNPRTKGEVLEMATAQFPDDPELTQAAIDAYVEEKKFLEASIAARQFALFFPDYPDASNFSVLADKYMKKYRSNLKATLIGQTILGCGTGLLLDGSTGGCMAALLIKGESRLGAQLSADQQQKETLVEDPEVNQYIKDIGDRLTPLMGRDDFEYEYHVVQDDSLNAFVFPGGKIFINTGTILQTNSEAELAGIIAHEISHAVFSHTYQRIAEQGVGMGLSKILPVGGLLNIALRANSRRHEKQADILGTRVLSASGYAADGLRNFMQILSDSKESSPPEWLSTHPSSEKRVRYLEELVLRGGYDQFAYEGVERHRAIQNRLRGQM